MKRAFFAVVGTVWSLYMVISYKTPPMSGAFTEATSIGTEDATTDTTSQSTTTTTTLVVQTTNPNQGTKKGSTTTTQVKKSAATTTTAPTKKSAQGPVVQTEYGPVQVGITVVDGRIVEATALKMPASDPTSVAISRAAAPKLVSATLEAQSANLGHVSGATAALDAWSTSLAEAMSTLGL